MSSSSLRAMAATVAGIVAIVTAIVVGLLADSTTCTVTPATVTVSLPAAAPSTAAPGDGLGNATSVTPSPPAPQPQTTTVPTQAVACDSPPFGPAPAVAALVGAALAALAAAYLLFLAGRRARAEGPGRPASVPVSGPPAVPAAAAGAGATAAGVRQAEADRIALMQAAIYVRDRVTSRALSDRLGSALHEAGVATLEPAGAPFDPTKHEAGGSAPSDDPAKVGSIAAVEVPGYADRGRLLRAPVVTVYQASGRTHGESNR